MNALFISILELLVTVIQLYMWVVIIASILSFVRPDPNNQLVQILYKLTQPAFDFVREKMPFVVFSGIDLSPLVIILALQFLSTFLINLMAG
ncbi:MAG: membrane protein [Sulfurovum sp. AS07-7]|nr:MAG: membrane protein [Sulfurovum sp. AS07-7]MBD3795097.1 YggT family protein [Campylobacterota bacterium]MBD3839002.1 YggT family protein [Campylobacterota bacterium]TQV61617.1 MAG: YggT family protein [Sulfurovum sp.]